MTTMTDESTTARPLTLTRVRLGLICAAVLLLGLVVGLFLPTPGAPSPAVEVEGQIGRVDSDNAAVAFIPTGERADLIEEGDDSVGAILANHTDGVVESGDRFEGRWLPDEKVLIVDKAYGQ